MLLLQHIIVDYAYSYLNCVNPIRKSSGVIPATAGIRIVGFTIWIPASAEMTVTFTGIAHLGHKWNNLLKSLKTPESCNFNI
jgi:hypothetical protein